MEKTITVVKQTLLKRTEKRGVFALFLIYSDTCYPALVTVNKLSTILASYYISLVF
jgi:hypothetical protein